MLQLHIFEERAWRLDKRGVEFLPFLPLVHPPKENNVLFCDELIPGLEWGVTQLDVPLNSWACAGFSTWENHRHVRKYNIDTGGFQSSTGYRKQFLPTFSGVLNCFKSLDNPGTRIQSCLISVSQLCETVEGCCEAGYANYVQQKFDSVIESFFHVSIIPINV